MHHYWKDHRILEAEGHEVKVVATCLVHLWLVTTTPKHVIVTSLITTDCTARYRSTYDMMTIRASKTYPMSLFNKFLYMVCLLQGMVAKWQFCNILKLPKHPYIFYYCSKKALISQHHKFTLHLFMQSNDITHLVPNLPYRTLDIVI